MATKYLNLYRKMRAEGRTVKASRAIALFAMMYKGAGNGKPPTQEMIIHAEKSDKYWSFA